MPYKDLARRESQRLEDLVEQGEMTPEEAAEAFEEFKWGYADMQRDIMIDRELEDRYGM